MPFKSKNLFSKKSSGVLSASQDLNITQPEASSTQAQEPSFVPVETPYASSTAFEPQPPTRAASAFDEHGSAPFDGAHTHVTQACLATQSSCLRRPCPALHPALQLHARPLRLTSTAATAMTGAAE